MNKEFDNLFPSNCYTIADTERWLKNASPEEQSLWIANLIMEQL